MKLKMIVFKSLLNNSYSEYIYTLKSGKISLDITCLKQSVVSATAYVIQPPSILCHVVTTKCGIPYYTNKHLQTYV